MAKIYCKDCEHFDKCVRGYMPDCPVYYPKKGIMTNEEWFCGLSMEEKATFFHGIVIRAMHATWDGKKPDYPAYLSDWKKWLKEIHKE